MDKKTWILVAIIGVAIVIIALIVFIIANIDPTNGKGYIEAYKEKEDNYITSYTWDESKIQAFYNTYYVDRGIENKAKVQSYILLRVETKDGDLKEGTYYAEAKGNILVYVVNEPIDLNTTEEYYEQIINETKEIKVKKGQYVYMVRGYNNKGSMNLKKK